MLTSFRIRNFKSIVDETIELGAFNVFIGQNGCGKTNILEALAMAAGAASDRLTTEDLFLRGIRIARPNLMASSFAGVEAEARILLDVVWEANSARTPVFFQLNPKDLTNHGSSWIDEANIHSSNETNRLIDFLERAKSAAVKPGKIDEIAEEVFHSRQIHMHNEHYFGEVIQFYCIYAPSTNSLRGLEASSRREPLGLYGENLDVALSQLSEENRTRLRGLLHFIDWIDDFLIDDSDRRKFDGLKLGRSSSRLYFHDRFMREDNRTFSAENANEGILHILFHLALFLVPNTPEILAIDNLETALNPGMCRRLVEVLAKLAVEEEKQALVTTHNPAILDGLNLHDDSQRLFVVYRNEEGHTKVRRVRMKPDADPGRKLSELWLRGHLGALPQGF